jgi:O-antigen ligase
MILMITGDIDSRNSSGAGGSSIVLISSALILAGAFALLMGGVVTAQLFGGRFGTLGLYGVIGIIGAVLTSIIIILRQDELAVTLVIAVQLLVDFYTGLHIVSQVMALALLVIFFLARSPQHPWVKPHAIWLWVLFLLLALPPALRGATNAYDAAFYYPNIFLGAFLIFWIGTLIARDSTCIRRLFMMLAFFSTLIAIHSIIQEITGKFFFETASTSAFLASVSNYQFSGTTIARVGSFFTDPNWDGTFLAMMLPIVLGLFVDSRSLAGRVFYIVELGLLLAALMFTFSIGAIISAGVGFVFFIIFVGHTRYRILLPIIVVLGAAVIIAAFPTAVALFLQHASNPNEALLRSGAWKTALRVTEAFPLMGIGLGFQIYQLKAEPYRTPAQYLPLAHPHNSYLELSAMAGLPVLLVFLALLLCALRLTLRNWIAADPRTRSLLSAGIAAAMTLSINSMSINGWTLPPLAAVGWLILGATSSSLLRKSQMRNIDQKSDDTIIREKC